MNKKGKLASLLFIGVTILPLLALLIMDYQVSRANDLTGAYLMEGTAAYASENLLAGAVVLGLVLIIVVTITTAKIRDSKLIATMPLQKINAEIKSIDEHLNKPKE